MSVWRAHTSLEISAPVRAIAERRGIREKFRALYIMLNRMIPYEPSFKSTPAKIIEPATGASTWALGSHKWTVYRGIFTINARIARIHNVEENIGMAENRVSMQGEENENELFEWKIKEITRRRGKEAQIVYIIKYVPA